MAKREKRGIGANASRVLVVEDDQDIRHSVRLALEDAGYQVGEACDGLAAIEYIRKNPAPMVVVLDLMMPKLDGAGVIGVIAGDRHLVARLRIVVMTAVQRTQPLAFSGLLTALSIRVISKPFELDVLIDAVQAAAAQLPPI
jgi:CheY-like chemotaxis protein